MPHVDEGTLHALLDGELGAAEVLEVQTHFATCSACAARLDEARQLLAETERLVSALEPPAAAGAATAAGMGPSTPRLMVGKPMIPLDPVVLIPNNPTPTEVRRSRFKIMVWAAGFLVVVGAGFFGLEMKNSLPGSRKAGKLRIRPEEFTFGTTKGQDSAAAANQQAAAQAPPPSADSAQRPSALTFAKPQAPAPQDQRAAGARPDSAPAAKAPANQPPAPKQLADNPPAPQPKAPPPPAKAADKTQPPPAKAQQKPQPTPPAQPQAPPPAAESKVDGTAADEDVETAGASTQGAANQSAPKQDTDDRATLVSRAAKATEALDRERMRERAAAATADLDRQREEEQAAAAAAAAEAQRRDSIKAAQRGSTIDQQARLSSRIGLDEAAHQLGGPLHAIDGMTRQLVGLVSPQLVPGSDTTRPVVRAVYVDRTGRTIYLDQQRVRPGRLDLPFTPQTGPNGQQMWMAGSTLLVLQSDLGPDSLRSLARRVR